MEKILILTRGCPSSGKSTVAQLFSTKAICCADDYFTHKGVYSWDKAKIEIAHAWCQRKCRRFMKKQAQRIVIANTLTTERELQPYVDLAKQFNYMLVSLVVENRHGNINVHNVPEATLEKMKNRFEIKLL